MKSKLVIGSYLDIDSFFHKVTPLIKLLLFFFTSILAINCDNVYGYIIFLLIFLSGISLSGIGIKFFLKVIKPLLIIFLWVLVFQLIFTHKGDVILDLYIIKIYSQAINNSIFLFFRMFILIGVAAILTLSTSPIEITHGLEDLLKPLRYIKVPVEEIALIISISLRFIPLFFDEIEKIKIAQISKGYDIEELNFLSKINYYGVMIIPLLLTSVKKAETLADAMIIRGYGSGSKKTRYSTYRLGKNDLILTLIFVGIITIIYSFS